MVKMMQQNVIFTALEKDIHSLKKVAENIEFYRHIRIVKEHFEGTGIDEYLLDKVRD